MIGTSVAPAPWLLAMRGLPGAGKSTLSRALSRELGWPLIDKDDCKDILDGRAGDAGGLAYAIMLNVARRQLCLGLSVIADSPLSFERFYLQAREITAACHAGLAVLECRCADDVEWQRRIDGRKALALPAHHQVDWASFQVTRAEWVRRAGYPIRDPHLVVDTLRPIPELLADVTAWLTSARAALSRTGP